MVEVEKKWASKIGLVGLFEIEWRTPHHDLLVEFCNSWKVENENRIYARIKEKVQLL
jgi:hypothetical protein